MDYLTLPMTERAFWAVAAPAGIMALSGLIARALPPE